MEYKLTLLTDNDIKKGARGRVLNNGNLNLKYKTNDTDISIKEYKLGGLYDPKIFGFPNRCPCGRTNVVNVRCPVCQVMVLGDDDYIKSYGYYELHIPYLSSIKVDGFISKIKNYFPLSARNLKDLWSTGIKLTKVDSVKDEALSYVKYDQQIYELTFIEIPEEGPNEDPNQYSIDYFGLYGFSNLSDFKTLSGEPLSWINSFINYNLMIPSPAIRPVSKIRSGDDSKFTFHELTINYGALIDLNETIPLLMENDYTKLVDKLTLCYYFNICINRVLQDNELLLPSKESFIRNIVDTRLSKSIRANIVSALDLEMDKMYVPRVLAYKALQVDIINKLIRDINYASEADCIKMYKTKDPKALEAFQYVIDHCMITMVRNPSLHRFALQAYHPILWDEICIGVPIAVDEVYNADHDGDTVYIQFHTDELKCAKLLDITPDKLWFYDKEYKPYVTFKHEELYGLHMASKITEPSKGLQCYRTFEDMEKAYLDGKLSMTEKCMLNDKQTTYGRQKIVKLSGGLDIDSYAKGVPIDTKNVVKLVSALGYHDNRKKEYLDLQTFGAEVSTLTSFGGAVPYKELYKGDPKEIENILSSDNPNDIKVNMLNDLIAKNIKEEIKNLPESNIDDLMKGAGKVSISKLAGAYAPALTVDNQGIYVNQNETLLNGLSERAFNNMASQNRGTLKMKQELTPIGGFLQRQLVNACLNLIFKNEVGSPDTKGILLEGKDALGRTDLNGNIITSVKPGRVLVKSCINNDTNIVYADEISVRDFKNPEDPTLGKKFNLRDGASIGVAFGSDIAEQIVQSGLAFKHGGSLTGMDRNVVKALESGTVIDITQNFIVVAGNHTYKYLKTECATLYDNVKIGELIQEGSPILKHDKSTAADDKVAMFNTLVKAQVVNDGPETLGAYRDTSSSVYNLTTGEIKYSNGYLDIGGTTYLINQNDIYYYPIGYELNDKYIRLSDGIPDMSAYWDKSGRSIQDTYYIFYYHILTEFKDMNSDVFEIVFKCIYKNNFSLKSTIDNKDSLIDRLYYGGATQNFKKEIKESEVVTNEKGQIETTIKLTDSIILPMILGRKSTEL